MCDKIYTIIQTKIISQRNGSGQKQSDTLKTIKVQDISDIKLILNVLFFFFL